MSLLVGLTSSGAICRHINDLISGSKNARDHVQFVNAAKQLPANTHSRHHQLSCKLLNVNKSEVTALYYNTSVTAIIQQLEN